MKEKNISVVRIEHETFKDCLITSITLPKSIVSIGEYAFSGYGLTEVIIPDYVSRIGMGAFTYCSNLTK